MLGSFDECKGSASLLQSLLHSLPMTAKIVHETFLLYLVIFFIYHKNTTNSLARTYIKTQKSSTTQENGLETKLQPKKKRFRLRKSAFFSIPPPQIPSKHRCRAVLDCPQSTPLRPVLQTKDSAFWWRYTPSVERSTTMSKNSSAFYAEQTTFRQKASSFLTKWPRGKREPPTLCRNNVGGSIASQ